MDERKQGRPTFIWELSTLGRLLGHPSRAVQEWAASHILELYPEAAEQALQALPQVSSGAAFHLLDSLQHLALSEAGVGPLQQFLRGGGQPYHKALAASLLVRHGKTLPQHDLSDLPMEMVLNRLSDTEPGFEFLMRRYCETEVLEERLVDAIAQACGALDLLRFLEEYSSKEVRRELRTLEKLWQVKLPALQGEKAQRDAQRLLQEALEVAATADTLSPSEFPLLAGQLRQGWARFTTLLEATREREAKGHPVPHQMTNLLLAGTLALHRDAACLRALAARPQVFQLLWCLALRPWQGRQLDPDLIASLKDKDLGSALSAFRQLLASGWGYFVYPYYLLEALKVPGHHELLEEALDGRYEENVASEAEEAAKTVLKDPEALEALLGRWRQHLPSPHRLYHLGEHPSEEVVEFLLHHFDEFMSQPFSSSIIEVMGDVASSRFLGPLIQEWREGEPVLERTIWFLAELHGREGDARVRHIPRHIQDQEELLESLQDPTSLLASLREKPTPVPLRCTVCQRTYRYQLERVSLGKRPGDVGIAQIVQCKGCGSLETYEITEESRASLSMEVLRLTVLMELPGEQEPPDTPLIPQRLQIAAAGKRFRSMSEAYHFLLQAVEQEPENFELCRRLANVLRNGLRPDLALPHYQEAVRLDPKDIESVYCIADVLVEQERYQEAVPHVEALVRLCRDPETDEDLCRSVFGNLLELAFVIEQETGRRIDLFPGPGQQDFGTGWKAREPRVLQLFDLDLSDPEDFKDAYQLFRHGTPPRPWEERHREERAPGLWAPEPVVEPYRAVKIGRNDPCPCGSGRKYKRCCGR